MTHLLNPKIIRINNFCCLWIPVIWWSICYAIWLSRGCKPFLPLISEFDSWNPESTVFTTGVTITAMTMLLRIVQLHQMQKNKIAKLQLTRKWSTLNHLTLMPGLIAILSVGALAHVPWNREIVLHMKLAKAIFEWGTLWCVLMTCLSWKFTEQEPLLLKALKLRFIGSALTAIGLIGITLTAVPIFRNNPGYIAQRIEMSLTEPMLFCTHSPKPEMTQGAAFEWLLVIGMLFVSWTFNADLRQKHSPRSEN